MLLKLILRRISLNKEIQSNKQQPTLLEDIKMLMIKILIIIVALLLIFQFIFGIKRIDTIDMSPSIKDGDLVIYYRLDKEYRAGDTVVFNLENETKVSRVIAVEGDKVDITKDGLFVNGFLQHDVGEIEITKRTERYQEGIDFPIQVGPGEIFVLGDNRDSAIDSRIFGTIFASKSAGTVVFVMRIRGI